MSVMADRSNNNVFSTNELAPRAWFKLEDGFSEGFKVEDGSMDEELGNAFNELTPGTEYDVFRLHHYEAGQLKDKPNELVIRACDEEEYTMYALKIIEPDVTTGSNLRMDDRRGHLPVNIQAIQGQDHGYAHKSNLGRDETDTLGSLEGLGADMLRGRDDEEWVLYQDTGPWTSKMDPTLIDVYRDAPRGEHLLEGYHEVSETDKGAEVYLDAPTDILQVAVYLDNFRDTIDVIVELYESEPKAWEDVRERNYGSMAERLDGISEEGLKNMLEEFSDQMDIYSREIM